MIHRFLWKLIGADKQVLKNCPVDERAVFSRAGAVVLLALGLCFFSIYYSCSIVFENNYFIIAFTIFWSMAMGNLYMLNIITIDSSSLPQKKTNLSTRPALLIRLFLISLLAIIISKPLELFLFGEARAGHLLDSLHHLHPLTTFFSLITLFIFLLPIYMKLTSLRSTGYGEKRKEIETRLVLEEYSEFRNNYSELMQSSIAKNIPYAERFIDPPFNTEKKKDSRVILGKGKLIAFLKRISERPRE